MLQAINPRDVSVSSQGLLQEFIEGKDKTIEQKDSLIQELRRQIRLEQKRSEITTEQLAKEIYVLYPYINDISLSESVKFNLKDNNVDTVPTLNINWSKQPTDLEYSHDR